MINYQHLADSVTFYEEKGFTRIETPWLVSPAVDALTKPVGVQSYHVEHNDKCLVASGEQSFLYLYLKEYLPLGKFQTITPCYRAESFDFLHSKTFIKNELIITDNVDNLSLKQVIDDAMDFFKNYLPEDGLVIVPTKHETGFASASADIEFNGIELGSYGIRECEYLRWIYATGCAEPRLSKVIQKYNNGKYNG